MTSQRLAVMQSFDPANLRLAVVKSFDNATSSGILSDWKTLEELAVNSNDILTTQNVVKKYLIPGEAVLYKRAKINGRIIATEVSGVNGALLICEHDIQRQPSPPRPARMQERATASPGCSRFDRPSTKLSWRRLAEMSPNPHDVFLGEHINTGDLLYRSSSSGTSYSVPGAQPHTEEDRHRKYTVWHDRSFAEQAHRGRNEEEWSSPSESEDFFRLRAKRPRVPGLRSKNATIPGTSDGVQRLFENVQWEGNPPRRRPIPPGQGRRRRSRSRNRVMRDRGRRTPSLTFSSTESA